MTWFRRATLCRVARLLPLLAIITICASCSDFWVSNSAVDHISVSPSALLLKKADVVSLSASTVTVGGVSTDVTTKATWSTSPAASGVATVDNTGKVTINTAGSVSINAVSGGKTGTATILAASSTLPTAINLGNIPAAASASLNPGATFKLTASGLMDGTSVDLSNFVSWTSSNSAGATVDSFGNVTVLSTAAAGVTFTITAQASTSAGGTITGGATLSVI